MVTSDPSQSLGAEARSCTGPLGGYGAAPEDTLPPLPLQDPTRGAETMRRRRISEAAGPHLRHRVSALPSLMLAGLQAADVIARKLFPSTTGTTTLGRLGSHLPTLLSLTLVP